MVNEKYDIKDVYSVAGESLSKVLDVYFPDEQELINWFYIPNERLGTSPYEFCKEGKQDKLEDILMFISQGAGGS